LAAFSITRNLIKIYVQNTEIFNVETYVGLATMLRKIWAKKTALPFLSCGYNYS